MQLPWHPGVREAGLPRLPELGSFPAPAHHLLPPPAPHSQLHTELGPDRHDDEDRQVGGASRSCPCLWFCFEGKEEERGTSGQEPGRHVPPGALGQVAEAGPLVQLLTGCLGVWREGFPVPLSLALAFLASTVSLEPPGP